MLLKRERRGHVEILTLERPEVRNAFNAGLACAVYDAFEEADADDAVRAVVLTGSGDKSFSAGADLKALSMGDPSERGRGINLSNVCRRGLVKPLVAAVNGTCLAGGLELALACDLIVAERMARFCFPELRLGLVPGFGGIPRLKRDLGNAVVRDLLLTGRSLNAVRAHGVGLVAQLVGEGAALRAARSTARQIAKFDATTVAAAKRFVKPLPREELQREIDLFCELLQRPTVEEALRKFVTSTEVQPYLP